MLACWSSGDSPATLIIIERLYVKIPTAVKTEYIVVRAIPATSFEPKILILLIGTTSNASSVFASLSPANDLLM